MRSAVLFILCLLPLPAFAADELRLRFPVDCILGQDCWLMNLPDANPDKDKAQDFTCGTRAYDTHSGTDIAIRDEGAMKDGIAVVAAADGKVTRLRDGEQDSFLNKTEQKGVKDANKDCGNGLIIDHGMGWTTQYCHLRQGSFKVHKDEEVKAGQPVAEVGLSGITDHPHLHLTLRHNDDEIDPFTGAPLKSGCGQKGQALWTPPVNTDDFNLYDAGFAQKAPDFGQISQGKKPPEPDMKSENIVFWFAYFAALKGDRISLQITTPSGTVLAEHQVIQDKNQARQYYFAGRPLTKGLPQRGMYKGEARVTRIGRNGNTITQKIVREIAVE